jgi:hypothetical protein
MAMRHGVALVLITVLAATGVAQAAGPDAETSTDISSRATRAITIPAGTVIRLRLANGVSSARSRVEDSVLATVNSPITVRGVTVIPAGSRVSGYVSDATRPGRVKGRAHVAVRFNTLRVGDTRYTMRTAAVSRQGRATKKADATKIGIGAGTGAVVGAVAGGKKGAAIGAAVGGAGGTGLVLATRGEDVAIGRGTVVVTRLTGPLMVRVK